MSILRFFGIAFYFSVGVKIMRKFFFQNTAFIVEPAFTYKPLLMPADRYYKLTSILNKLVFLAIVYKTG